MIMKIFNLTVDFDKAVTYRPITFVKGDRGSCKLVMNIAQDISGHDVNVAFKLADGTHALHAAEVIDANSAELVLPSGVLSVAGAVSCQVALYEGDNRLTNAVAFRFNVAADLAEEAIQASDHLPVLTQLITDVTALDAAVTAAEDARVLAESGRVSAESSRSTAEGNRVTAENVRASNETSRGNAETARATAESGRSIAEGSRVSAESARATAETNRSNAESGRVTAESGRATAEGNRISAEDARATAETNRAASEASRDANETARVNNEADRILAESGRVTAEEGRVAAETQRVTNDADRMLKSTYDPDSIAGDVFDMDNMKESPTAKIMTAEEREALAELADPAQYSTPVETVDEIIEMPVGTRNAPVKLGAKGVTVRNCVKNNDISDGVNGFASGSSVLSATENILASTSNGSTRFVQFYEEESNLSYVAGDKIFVFSRARVTNSDCDYMRMQYEGGEAIFIDDVIPSQNEWYEFCKIVAMTETIISPKIWWLHRYPDVAIANGKVMEVDGRLSEGGGVFAVKLAGVIADITKEQALFLIHAMEAGTQFQHTKNPNYLVQGKNLINLLADKVLEDNVDRNRNTLEFAQAFLSHDVMVGVSRDGYYKNSNAALTSRSKTGMEFSVNSISYGIGFKIKVTPNTVYSKIDIIDGIGFFDKDGYNISYINEVNSVTTPSNCEYILYVVYGAIGDNVRDSDIQLERGLDITEFLPFESNSVSIREVDGSDLTLRSVNNEISDEVDFDGRLIKNINELMIDGTEAGWFYNIAYTNTYRFVVNGYGDDKDAYFKSPDLIVAYAIASDGSYIVSPTASSDRRQLSLYESGTLYLNIEQSKIDAQTGETTLDKFKSYLAANPITFGYRLNKPVISGVQKDELWAYTSGRMIQQCGSLICEVEYSVAKNYQASVDAAWDAIKNIDDRVARLENAFALHVAGV